MVTEQGIRRLEPVSWSGVPNHNRESPGLNPLVRFARPNFQRLCSSSQRTAQDFLDTWMLVSQAEGSTRSQYSGTGLGLLISRHFCRLMGGDPTLESEYGEGATFTVRLPAEVPNESEAPA